MKKKFTLRLPKFFWKDALLPYAPVAFALLSETLELLLFVFALLITVEAFLPGFISLTASFTKLSLLIFAIFAALVLLARELSLAFPFSPDKKSPLVWMGIMWLAFILTLSTIGFPPLSVPIIIGSFFAIAALFWKILFRGEA
jgi:hypothetical protein